MPEWLLSILAFLVCIGILVAVHEYGHFWVARRLGVRVLRYSLGFGYKLWGRTSPRTGTEFRVCAIPFGGYVKMLDEREGPVDEADKPYAFNRQHPLKRIAIVFAGPGVNILFAIFAYWLVLMIGVSAIKPVIGSVPSGSEAAQAGLTKGDRIVAVGSTDIQTWQALRLTLLERALDGGRVRLTVVEQDGSRYRTYMQLQGVPKNPAKLFPKLGLSPYRPPATPVVARIMPDTPAARSGLQAGDKILAVGGQAMKSPRALVKWIEAHPGDKARLKVKRDGEILTLTVTLGRGTENGKTVGHLGVAIGVDLQAWKAMRTTRQFGPLEAIPAAVSKTWDVTVLTLQLMGQMIVGDISWHNISGPIRIAQYAGQTASIGLAAFIGFMALVSISLAIINLLPIPVLDGGHLLYYAIEWIRGRPLPESVQNAGQQAGLVALMLLMGVAFYNDILHLLG